MDKTVLNRRRGNLKGQLSRLRTFIEGDISISDIFVIENKLESVFKIRNKIEALKEDYYQCLSDEELSDMEDCFAELETEAEDIQVSLKRFMVNSSVPNNINVSPMVNNIKSNSVRLPEIPLPSFSGRYEEWNVFKEQFVSMIESNENISEKQKLFYLQSALTGKAKYIQTTDDSYESLMSALKQRFENKRLIVSSHINDLLTLDKIKTESAKELRYLVDQVLKHLRALKQMELNSNQLTEVLLINILSQKIDSETRKQFEMSLTNTELPTWDNFVEFLQKRCQILENLQNKDYRDSQNKSRFESKSKNFLANSTPSCIVCQKSHSIYKCSEFQNMNVKTRFEIVKRFKLCINCLSITHRVADCKSKYVCSFCSRKHNSLIHDENKKKIETSNNPLAGGIERTETSDKQNTLSPAPTIEQTVCTNSRSLDFPYNEKGIIPTALIWVRNNQGQMIQARAILDTGSENCYSTTAFSEKINVNKQKISGSVCGLNNSSICIRSKIITDISNAKRDFVRTVQMFVVPKITGILPTKRINISHINWPQNINFADPTFASPGKIDILLNSSVFFDILKCNKITLENNSIVLTDTAFGYIVSGTVPSENIGTSYCSLLTENEDLNTTVKLFWETENIPELERIKGKEEVLCEEHFLQTHFRDNSGRYVVQIPFKKDPSCLGDSKQIALQRLNSLWKRLIKNPEFLDLYKKFIEEYLEMGHMEEVLDKQEPEIAYYLPHHGVHRPTNISTPLRVVYNASTVTSTGESLNSLQMNGGVIQDDLFSILMRFRKYKYGLTADIKKMFRMILIDSNQRDLQRILWKEGLNEPVKTYRLCTISYGTTSASHLATRVLKQLAIDEGSNFPLAASVVLSDVYMDDILSGSQDLETAQKMQFQLKAMLQRGGMELHKWMSNSVELFRSSLELNQELSLPHDQNSSSVKALGLNWHPEKDMFFFKLDLKEELVYSKREVLSVIARLYDPLGLVGPITCKAKIFLQGLWQEKLNWEETLSPELGAEWQRFMTSLKTIEELRIPRWILIDDSLKTVLHCFVDSSQKAFGAVIYMQCILQNNTASTKLLTSKSRVAPLKTISIPRLELCACLLGAQLLQKVRQSLKMNIDNIVLYSDSTISLAWIKSPSHQLKSFVANRVAKIQELTENCLWKHVPSSMNPADIISRGVYPNELSSLDLWWHGPPFLQVPEAVTQTEEEDIFKLGSSYQCELKNVKLLNFVTLKSDFIDNFLNICNNYDKLINIFSYISRFINNCKSKIRKGGPLTVDEVTSAEAKLISIVQRESFPEEVGKLSKAQQVSGKSCLKMLYPFMDTCNIIRVGGRLREANLPYDSTHPIILPKGHRISTLIMLEQHDRNFHLGAQALLHCTRQKFWIIGGRTLARKIVYGCVTCAKLKPKILEQLMGDLPIERLTPSFPFNHTGVDFGGPFFIKYKGQRKGTLNKIYVAIFICFTTRAIHLEIVSDLTSESFISSLKRFISRRGNFATLFSDNAKNFVGANNELKRLHNLVKYPDETLAKFLTSKRITWKFIPPRAPHFGGLWEAGIKSYKYHLKRAMGSLKFTYEEFLTITNQIEGFLNSRPITPISADPNDFNALTPAHFLIGRPMMTIVEPELVDKSDNVLRRWQRTTKVTQYLWKRWQRDYLTHLQQRSKWHFEKENVKEGSMVVIKEDNLPPSKWLLGRIEQLILGKDERVRVCLIKTKTGLLKRPITKLAILPINLN